MQKLSDYLLSNFPNEIGKGGDSSGESAEDVALRLLSKLKAKQGQLDGLDTKALEEAARPLMKYLCENHHPHVTVIVTPIHAELLEGLMGTANVLDYVKD